jgi:hypothetical protein
MISDYYNKTGFRIRITAGKNASGTPSETENLSYKIQGALRGLSKQIQYTNDKRTVFADHRWYCDPCDLAEADRLRVDGIVYQIARVNNIQGVNMQVDLYRVD